MGVTEEKFINFFLSLEIALLPERHAYLAAYPSEHVRRKNSVSKNYVFSAKFINLLENWAPQSTFFHITNFCEIFNLIFKKVATIWLWDSALGHLSRKQLAGNHCKNLYAESSHEKFKS